MVPVCVESHVSGQFFLVDVAGHGLEIILIGAADYWLVGIALGDVLKQAVVELDDVAGTAVVGRGGFARGGTAVIVQAIGDIVLEVLVHFLAEHCGIGIAESVDGLLGVTDEHIEVAARQTLMQQPLEIIVLLGTGVLKLVDHEVGNRRSDTFIYKG